MRGESPDGYSHIWHECPDGSTAWKKYDAKRDVANYFDFTIRTTMDGQETKINKAYLKHISSVMEADIDFLRPETTSHELHGVPGSGLPGLVRFYHVGQVKTLSQTLHVPVAGAAPVQCHIVVKC